MHDSHDLRNTLEQSVLAAVAWCGLALPAERLGLIPVLAILFVLGRVLFWAGYQLHPVARALGFGLSAADGRGARLARLAPRRLSRGSSGSRDSDG